jgi:hypothetical protein
MAKLILCAFLRYLALMVFIIAALSYFGRYA